MLVDLNRRIFKITAFFCVVVSVFSDGRMGFYRGAAGDVSGPDALLCPAFACMVCAVRGVAVVLFAGACRCVFAVRRAAFFFGGGCRRGRFDRWQGGIKMERVGKWLQNGVGTGVPFRGWCFLFFGFLLNDDGTYNRFGRYSFPVGEAFFHTGLSAGVSLVAKTGRTHAG